MAGAAADDTQVKLVLLGDTGVGKSSLVLRFVNNIFKPFSESTIGAAFMSKTITVDGQPIKYQIWDTAGQEKVRSAGTGLAAAIAGSRMTAPLRCADDYKQYHSLAPMYYRGAAAAIVVYDITRPSSFTTLKSWVNELHQHGPEDIVLAIAGNKCDMEDRRKVATSDAEAYAKSIGALFMETSAKLDKNVQDLFVDLSRKIPSAGVDSLEEDDTVNVRGKPKRSKGCC